MLRRENLEIMRYLKFKIQVMGVSNLECPLGKKTLAPHRRTGPRSTVLEIREDRVATCGEASDAPDTARKDPVGDEGSRHGRAWG